MNKELIINSSAQGVQIALLEDKKLVELHNEKADASFNVGDLYLGRVKKLIPGLNAAFVDVGFEKDAFLHYTDLSPFAKSLLKFTQLSINSSAASQPNFSTFTVEAEIVKTGKINEVLGQKPNVLVQILKEPIAAKGPTAAEGNHTAELHEDLNVLFSKWKSIQQNLSGAVAPAKILSEQTKATSILRDLLNADFNKIVVNDKQIFADTMAYIQKIAPDKAEIVSLYTGSASVFDHTGITKQVKGAFGKTVNLPSGAYLIIEHTEALHVIDVNSGYKSVSNNQEENALQTNMEAAEEIARQLRLRDIGGIIVVDFIDMKLPENKKKLNEAMENFMKIDRAKHAVLAISKFGLMQLTRQRMKPEMNINTQEQCPSCQGTGKISSTLVLEDEIEKNISYLSEQKHTSLTVAVHPILYAYLTKGIISKRRKWAWKYKMKLDIRENSTYHLTEFHFFDNHDEEIRL